MRRIQILIISIVFAAAGSAQARIGESPEEIETRFGKPVKEVFPDSGPWEMRLYFKLDQTVIAVSFKDDKSAMESYQFPTGSYNESFRSVYSVLKPYSRARDERPLAGFPGRGGTLYQRLQLFPTRYSEVDRARLYQPLAARYEVPDSSRYRLSRTMEIARSGLLISEDKKTFALVREKAELTLASTARDSRRLNQEQQAIVERYEREARGKIQELDREYQTAMREWKRTRKKGPQPEYPELKVKNINNAKEAQIKEALGGVSTRSWYYSRGQQSLSVTVIGALGDALLRKTEAQLYQDALKSFASSTDRGRF